LLHPTIQKKLASLNFNGFSHVNFKNEVFVWLNQLYPQKCMYLGCVKVKELICRGLIDSSSYYLNHDARAAYILVVFIVGNEFKSDHFHLYDDFFSLGKDCSDDVFICKVKGFLGKYIDTLIV